MFSAVGGCLKGGLLLGLATTMWLSCVVYVLSSSWHGYGLKVMGSRLCITSAFFLFFRLQHLYRYRFRSFTFVWAVCRASPLLIGLDWVGYRGSRGGRIPHAHCFLLRIVITYHYTLSMTISDAACAPYSFHLPSTIFHPPSPTSI